MKMGSAIRCPGIRQDRCSCRYAVRAAVYSIMLFPIYSAGFPGQTPYFTPSSLKEKIIAATGTTGDLNIFPSRLASREMRRSHLKVNTGLFRPDIS